MPTTSQRRGKQWCFTLFAYDEAKLRHFSEFKTVKKFVCQEERSPETRRLHIQGYVAFDRRYRFNEVIAITRFVGLPSAHVEGANGSEWQNYCYCTKSDTSTGRFRITKGEFVRPRSAARAERSQEFSSMVDDIKRGKSSHYIAITYPKLWLQRSRGIPALVNEFRIERSEPRSKLAVCVLWGAAGVGKSFWARQYAVWHEKELYSMPPPSNGAVWFDGYNGEKVLLIDDMGCDAINPGLFLNLLDLYDLKVPVKGGFVEAAWDTVIITSNFHPDSWFRESLIDRAAVTRRLTKVVECTVNMSPLTEHVPFKQELPSREQVQFERKEREVAPNNQLELLPTLVIPETEPEDSDSESPLITPYWSIDSE
jgi:hypothetical protein